MFSFFQKKSNSTTIKIGDLFVTFSADGGFQLPNIKRSFKFHELRSAIGGANASLVKAEVQAQGYKLAS